jgi:hypothetical protein
MNRNVASILPLIDQINRDMQKKGIGLQDIGRGKSESGFRSTRSKPPIVNSEMPASTATIDSRRYKNR